MMRATVEDGDIVIRFPASARLNISKSGKSVIVCKVLRPERVPGTEVFVTMTAYIAKAQVDPTILATLTAEASAA